MVGYYHNFIQKKLMYCDEGIPLGDKSANFTSA